MFLHTALHVTGDTGFEIVDFLLYLLVSEVTQIFLFDLLFNGEFSLRLGAHVESQPGFGGTGDSRLTANRVQGRLGSRGRAGQFLKARTGGTADIEQAEDGEQRLSGNGQGFFRILLQCKPGAVELQLTGVKHAKPQAGDAGLKTADTQKRD